MESREEKEFTEEDLYGKTQKEKLEELKEQLKEMEESKTRRGR